MKVMFMVMLSLVLALQGCSGARADGEVDPRAIEAKYGVRGAFVDDIVTEEGKIRATVVPTTLDGRDVQLIVPHQRVDDDHQVFVRDGITIMPIELSDPKLGRQDFIQSQPRVVERRVAAATPHKKKRSLEKEILIVGGSAGAGAAIGALAGGKKGAGIGALSGGVAGLVYDLATRNK